MIGLRGSCECGSNPDSQDCIACRRSWFWDDGSDMDYDAYHAWIETEPDSGEECARLASNGEGWAGRRCDKEFNYICKNGTLMHFLICRQIIHL